MSRSRISLVSCCRRCISRSAMRTADGAQSHSCTSPPRFEVASQCVACGEQAGRGGLCQVVQERVRCSAARRDLGVAVVRSGVVPGDLIGGREYCLTRFLRKVTEKVYARSSAIVVNGACACHTCSFGVSLALFSSSRTSVSNATRLFVAAVRLSLDAVGLDRSAQRAASSPDSCACSSDAYKALDGELDCICHRAAPTLARFD